MDEHEATAGARQHEQHQREHQHDGQQGDGATAPATGRRGGERAAGAALAVVAIAGTALGAMLLRPGGSLLAKSAGPLDNTAAVILIAVAALAGGLVLSGRYRARLGYQQNLPPFEQRLADVVRVALVAAALLVPLLLLGMHRFPKGGTAPTAEKTGDDWFPTVSRRPDPPHGGHPPGHAPQLTLPHILVVIGAVLLLCALLVAGYLLWRRLRRQAVPAAERPYRPAEEELLADAVDSGRRALLDGTDARAAVIACYAAMEASLAGSGVARRASDSPQDLLERAAGSGLLAGPHATALTALFREARYSTHPMDRTHRDRAAGALDAIAAQLAERARADGVPQDGGEPGPQPTAGAHR